MISLVIALGFLWSLPQLVLAVPTDSDPLHERASSETEKVKTIYRDVAIIGGGASGSYAAVRLRDDYNLSIVLIEKDDMLGGHVNTYTDPETGRGFDAGVQNYLDVGDAQAFFARMGVPTAPYERYTPEQVYVDFATGQKLTNYQPPPNEDRIAALHRFRSFLQGYLPILEPGYWNFPSSDPPEELVLPMRDIIERYNLTAGVPQIFMTTGFGVGDMLDIPALWLARAFNFDMVSTLLGLQKTNFQPASKRNQDLYDAVLKHLGSEDVLLSSTVVSSSRSAKEGVTLKVQSSKTHQKKKVRVVAKRLLFTPALTESNTAPFSLDRVERDVFSKYSYASSYVGVVTHPSLPIGKALVNMPAAAQPDKWLEATPKIPFSARFHNYANSSYFRVIASGDETLTSVDDAKQVIVDSFEKMVKAGTINQTEPPTPLKFLLFEPHGLVSAQTSREEIENGFIQRLNSLQGRRSTWYTGASWGTHLSTNVWVLTDSVLSRLVASL